ncbi:hypothetical protein EJB05_42675, partial [Eragrostis curvula]
MANTSPPCYRLAFLCIYTLVLCIHVPYASSFAFNFSTISTSPCGTDLVCWGNASFANQMIELTTNNISTGCGNSLGRVWYANPVPLWDAATAELASFTTTFSFKITPDKDFKNPEGSFNSGDGMAFFLAPYSTNVLSSSYGRGGRNLGLFNATGDGRVVAVGFDTFRNKWDNSGQHVGIDVNSIWSSASTDTSPAGDKINLISNTMMTAKINYDNQTKILAADLDIDGASYHVNYTVDLRLLLPEKVAVGFSAATGLFTDLHRISFWAFDSSLEEKVVPPASAPSQKTAYPSITIPPFKSKPSTKYSAATGSSPELQRILFSPSDDSPPAPAEYQKTEYPSIAIPPVESELHRSLFSPSESPPPALAPYHQLVPDSTSPPEPPVKPEPTTPPYHNQIPSDSTNATDNQDSTTKLLLEVLIPILSVSVLATVCVLVWLWLKRRRKAQQIVAPNDSESSDEQHGEEADFERAVAGPRRYHYRVLAAATGDFSDENRLGKGGFGSVYKGNLQGVGGDKQVAVKLLSSETSSQGRKQFEAEVKIIGQLRHRNLVQLLGWCDSPKGLLLVYELVPEGSLDKHIHSNPWLLTWPDRYRIIMGLGSALRYLHREWDQCVVHGDIKPSNIMLDSSYNTKLGDFGLARLVDHGTGPRTTMNVLGTPGYIDPEFVNTCRPSTESDVYSFGIVILEIVSGRQPLDRREPSFMLLKWVWSLYSQGKTIEAAELRGDEAEQRQMERALVVGLWCAHHDPGQRPSIVDAMLVLQSEDAKLPVLAPHMYKLVALPSVISNGGSGVSGSSFSSGVHSSATTGTTYSSQWLTYQSPIARSSRDPV